MRPPDANCPPRHQCARLRIPNTAAATDPLPATFRRVPRPGFDMSLTKIPAPCKRCSFGREAPFSVTSGTGTTRRRFGGLRPTVAREGCRWVSRPRRPSSPHQCLPTRFDQPIVVDDSLNRLKFSESSGEMTPPSGTGACDMGTTGTESVAPFAHAALHSGPGFLPFIIHATRCAATRRRCGTATEPHPAKAHRCASGLGYEPREGRHTPGRRVGPRPRADRQLDQPGIVSGPVGPIRLRPATCGNPTLRGRTVNRTPVGSSHGRIPGANSSPREKGRIEK